MEGNCETFDREKQLMQTYNGDDTGSSYQPRVRRDANRFEITKTITLAGIAGAARHRCEFQTFQHKSSLQANDSGLYVCLTVDSVNREAFVEARYTLKDAMTDQEVSCEAFAQLPHVQRTAELYYSVSSKKHSDKIYSQISGTYYGRTNRCKNSASLSEAINCI